jgi:restriction system protein
MLPVLRVAAAADEIWVRQAVEDIGDQLELSSDDRAALIPSGQKTVLANRVNWAKTYLTKAKLLESVRRGYFRITERGRQLLAESPTRIDNRTLSRFDEFQEFLRLSETGASPRHESSGSEDRFPTAALAAADKTPTEIILDAQVQLDRSLAEELIGRILTMPPDFFEKVVVNLVVAMGYGDNASDAGSVIGRSGDNGVDGVIKQDALGLDRVYIQAKRYGPATTVGGSEIRDFYGSLALKKANKGVFVTTSSFSKQAKETAEGFPSRIVLIDGAQLAELMIRYNVGCRTEETILIKRVDEDFFE